MRFAVLLLALLPAPVLAECPPVPDHADEFAALFDAARAAQSENAARVHTNRMWELWTDAPDEPSTELLNRGIEARSYGDTLGALDAFDRLIDYCPDYAEGWNQRAFIHYLSGAYDKALPDLERAVALNPDHVAALSGMALTLTALGREDEAQERLRQALALNPWISERFLLKKTPGTDL